MTRHWFEAGPDPEVFRDAQNWIGAPGFRIRGSASYASAVYSGVFCLLALRNARDWRRGEDIRLQELQDHHIFPQAYLKRHGITKRPDVNTIANRTLISDETNGKIKDKAPSDYLSDTAIFPSGARPDLLAPHFVGESMLPLLRGAIEEMSDAEAAEIYGRFLDAREAAMIEEIRRVCGVSALPESAPEQAQPDEVAADIKAGTGPAEDEDEGLDVDPIWQSSLTLGE